MKHRAELKAKINNWSAEGISTTCEVDFENVGYCDLVSMFTSIAVRIAGYTDESARSFIKDIYTVIVNMEKDGTIEAGQEDKTELQLIDRKDLLAEIGDLTIRKCTVCRTRNSCFNCFKKILEHVPEINQPKGE